MLDSDQVRVITQELLKLYFLIACGHRCIRQVIGCFVVFSPCQCAFLYTAKVAMEPAYQQGILLLSWQKIRFHTITLCVRVYYLDMTCCHETTLFTYPGSH